MRSMAKEGGFTFTKLWFYIVVVAVIISCTTAAVDTLISGQTLRDGETLVSPSGTFKLGFFSLYKSKNRYVFSLDNSTNRYVGMYSKDEKVVINLGAPLKNTSGELALTLEGSLVIRYANGHIVWSSRIKWSPKKLVARLLDNGEFEIRELDITGPRYVAHFGPDIYMSYMQLCECVRNDTAHSRN